MQTPEFQLCGMPYVPGLARGVLQRGLSADVTGCILVLTQAEIAPFDAAPPAGIVVIEGAPLSHTLIGLMGAGVPTVIIDAGQAASLPEGREVILDGASGRITPATGDFYPPADVMPEMGGACVTADGGEVQLRVSARDPQSARQAAANGAAAIGLVRSEFLNPVDGSVPDAAFYRHALQSLCAAAMPLPVTIRLIDIAADKRPAWLPRGATDGGSLGLQGVRLYAREPVRSVYRAQLTAIGQLAGEFDLRVLIPYPGSLEEVEHWLAEVRQRLPRPLPVGAMVETPAAALQIADWLEQADFVALGCNDLMQCLFGADRDRPELRHYLDPYAPSLYRFLEQIAASAPAQLPRVQLCGVLSQLPGVLPVLLGLGFSVFSVEAPALAHLRRTIASTSLERARALAERICAARHTREVRLLLGLSPADMCGRD